MTKYTIVCSTSRSYYLVVEAPSEEAAERYYERCDEDEFSGGDEGGWRLDDIREDDVAEACVTVDEWGDPIKEEK